MIFAAGAIAETVFKRLTAGSAIQDSGRIRSSEFTTRLGYLLQRLAWQVFDVLVFGIADRSLAFFAVYHGHGATRLTVMTYVLAVDPGRAPRRQPHRASCWRRMRRR